MKQTAVEWLRKEISELGRLSELLKDKFDQAKEMEKQQIIDFGYLQIQNIESELGDLIYKKVPEEIYNETFNK